MKRIRKSIMLLMITFVLICSHAVPVWAEAESYTYTIRLYPGQQGRFADGSEYITKICSYGDIVNLNPNSLSVVLSNDSKYYIKGVRESGKDNNTVSASSFIVTGDRDYVVAYGLKGNVVSYTVNYVDADGNALMPSDIYYGNVGDKPVVAFLYIDGYQPQTYNLTRTLVENEAENVFTFIYTPLSGYESTITVRRIVIPETVTSIVEVIPGETVRRSRTTTGTGEAQEGTALINGGQNGTDQSTGQTSLEELEDTGVPRDVIDLDEPEVPLSNMKFNIGPIEADARILFSAFIITMVVLVIAAASWWYWGHRRKKENNEK
ncbi:MAG: hypothetical protein HDR23_03160 [Lachnospiraceae bacterium]|nr:hypothetical protein [Lachnospiraceae bacterium]